MKHIILLGIQNAENAQLFIVTAECTRSTQRALNG